MLGRACAIRESDAAVFWDRWTERRAHERIDRIDPPSPAAERSRVGAEVGS
jgi:hypothetical protein